MSACNYVMGRALLHILAGVGGFEPPNGGVRVRCLTAWLHPKSERLSNIEAGVSQAKSLASSNFSAWSGKSRQGGLQSSDRFSLAEDGHHVEDAGALGSSDQGDAYGGAYFTQFQPGLFHNSIKNLCHAIM